MKYSSFNAELERLHQSPDDYRYGGLSQPCIAEIPEADREKYLPIGELQNIGEEKSWCATATPENLLEAKFTWLYQNNKLLPDNRKFLEQHGYVQNNRVVFSDAFNAIKSGTTRDGNSMKAPLQSFHEDGLIPKVMLPQLESFDETYDPKRITKEMTDLGKEFTHRFVVNYDHVDAIHFEDLLKDDFLVVAGFAWPDPINGIYPRTEEPMNHVFLDFREPVHTIFDNYLDTDGDFIKRLAPDYKLFDWGYRVYISKEIDYTQVITILQRLVSVLIQLRDTILHKYGRIYQGLKKIGGRLSGLRF